MSILLFQVVKLSKQSVCIVYMNTIRNYDYHSLILFLPSTVKTESTEIDLNLQETTTSAGHDQNGRAVTTMMNELTKKLEMTVYCLQFTEYTTCILVAYW